MSSGHAANYNKPLSNGRYRREATRGDSLKSFEKKLAETDAYLQLLINQVKDVDSKIEAARNEAEKAKLVDIKAKTLLLLDKVKLTIVSLQIAKVSQPGSQRELRYELPHCPPHSNSSRVCSHFERSLQW